MIRVALLCDQLRTQHDVQQLLEQEGFILLGCLDKLESVQARLQDWRPDVLVLAVPFTKADVTALIQDLCGLLPDAALVVLTRNTDGEAVRLLFHNGASDVLVLPRGLASLPGAIRDAVRSGPPGSVAGVRLGKTLAVWSPKGGVGTSVIAANLAVALQTRQRLRTLLVDLNGPYGGADVLLGLKPERSLHDLFPVMAELSPMHVAQALTKHSSGLSVLTAPRLTEPLGGLRAEHPSALALLCRNLFDVTILDVPSAWTPPVQAALEVADRILVVVTPDGPAIRLVQQGVQLLPLDRRERAMIGLVVNRTSADTELQVREIGEMVGLPVVGTIRSAFRPLERLVNTGQPVITVVPPRGRTPETLATDLERLAQRLA